MITVEKLTIKYHGNTVGTAAQHAPYKPYTM